LDNEDIEFDGLVIKINNMNLYSIIWYTAHHPKWAFAFKYPAKQVSTKIVDVELNVWRTWVITPVAILEWVEISWVIVKRATLHNFDFIKEKDIHIGDYVLVQRSWEVIPYIVGIIKERRDMESWKLKDKSIKKIVENHLIKAKKINPNYQKSYLEYVLEYKLYEKYDFVENNLVKIVKLPYCPVCWWETFKAPGEVALKCINVACPAQVKEKIVYFVWKDWLNIEGLAEKTIELLLKVWLIKDYWDIFYLPEKKTELLALPGFQIRKIENIINSIEQKNNIPLPIFLSALWIEFIWKKTAKIIAESLNFHLSGDIKNKIFKLDQSVKLVEFVKLVKFLTADEWEKFLFSINWIWPKVVESIKKFFHEKHNLLIIKKILNKLKIYLDE
jgi:DNA ligase (NAD+)